MLNRLSRMADLGACLGVAAILVMSAAASAEPSERVAVKLPSPDRYPRVTTTPERLERLRTAYRTSDHWRNELDETFIEPATRAMEEPLVFPPRGGIHSMWYHCPEDETPLQTMGPTQHRCPRCETVYSGSPYDDVLFARQHTANLRAARDAAWAYAITGDEQFAQFVARILVGYGERYRGYAYQDNWGRKGDEARASAARMYSQTLTEAQKLMEFIAPAYDLIRPTLDANQREVIEEGLIRPMLETIGGYPHGRSNWQSFHNGAMLWGGAMLGDGDAAWIDRAINDPEHGFLFQMAHSVTSDGMWYENSWSYHSYALTGLWGMARGAEHLGMDLLSHPVLVKMFLLPMRYAMPGGALPRFGDATTARVGGDARVEAMYHVLRDPRLIPLLPKEPSWYGVLYDTLDVPGRGEFVMLEGSDVMPGIGHVILRTQGEAGLALASTYGRHTNSHAHRDQLSFVFYGLGQELGVDAGRASPQGYNQPIHRRWYKHTLSHNAVLVDGQGQEPAESELRHFAFNDAYAAAVMHLDGFHDGVAQTRLLLLTPTYLLVFDDLAADAPHRYDWLYHNMGTGIEGAGQLTPVDWSGRDDGLGYLRDVRQGAVDASPIRLRFPDEQVTTHLLLTASSPSMLTLATGPLQNVQTRVPMVMLAQEGRADAWFAAVVEPRPSEAAPTVRSVEVAAAADGEGVVVTVTGDGFEDAVHLAPHGRVRVERDGAPVLTDADQVDLTAGP